MEPQAEQPLKVKPMDKADKEHEEPYRLPKGCKLKLVEPFIRRYQCFEHERRVYVIKGKVAIQVSNFTCAIHMHIVDEVPTRLISIINEDREEEVMHVPHDVFNSLQQFRKTVTGRGNFKWMGTEGDYMSYLWFMMDHMGKGRMILEPGMQPEGFFSFTNAALAGGQVLELDKFGCFDVGNTKYYVPAANTSTVDDTGYGNARRIIYQRSEVTFEQLTRQMLLVHGDHSMLALTHAVGTVFSDHIRYRLDGFPIPFYYGPPGTGKDQVVKSCQRLFGKPQPALRLPAQNTGPAQVNLFAELRNVPLYLTEWASNLKPEVHTFVMGVWDGEGRRRGEKVVAARSRFSTEDVPIRCTASVSGNEYPNHLDQFLDRLVVSEMKKLQLTMEMRENYRLLNDMNEQGYSYLLADIVKHREDFVANWFSQYYPKASDMVNLALGGNFISERMRKNITVLVSVHLFFARRLSWSFTTDMLLKFLVDCMVKQQGRRLSGDEVSNFWSCFIAGVNQGQLLRDRHFNLDLVDKHVGFYWNEVFTVYMQQHRLVFGTPGKRDILNKLKQHECFIPGKEKDVHMGYRIGLGENMRKSSAYLFDVEKTGTDLLGLISREEETANSFLGLSA